MIPESSREALLEAMERFDREQRDTLDWRNWQTWRSFKHAIEHEGRLYPVKQIISLATGTPVSSFSGGPEANTYVERLGFEVVPLHPEDGVSDRVGDVLEVLAAVRASDPATAEDVREARRRAILRIAASRDIHEGTVYDKLRRGLDLPSTDAFDNLVMGWVLEGDMALRDRLEAHASATARAADVAAIRAFFGDGSGRRERVLSNAELTALFRVGNSGGIRYRGPAESPELVVFSTDPPSRWSDHPYQDHWEGDVLHYTGQGLRGDHQMTSGNLALQRSRDLDFPVYGFERRGANQYVYLGRFKAEGVDEKHQPDMDGQMRRVFVFRMRRVVPDAPLPDDPVRDGETSVRNVWLFQANPRFFDLAKELANCRVGMEDDWSVTRYADEMRPGDVAILWQGGSEAGIYALGQLTGTPQERPYDPADPPAWVQGKKREGKPELAVAYRYTAILPEPIPKVALQSDPALSSMLVLRVPIGTNFRVTPAEWRALQPLLADALGADVLRQALVAQDPRTEDGREQRSDSEVAEPYREPSFDEIVRAVHAAGLSLPEAAIRRYHLALRARGFVILAGLSGSGKTWLAQVYAAAVGAKCLTVPVAPNWNTNEDLLGFSSPVTGHYHDTAVSRFLREAAAEYERRREGAQPYHLILDEMNLARVEYYFATFLSAMEVRAREGSAVVDLGPERVTLGPNLRFIGTVNVDETTHAFADKVYDRAQLIEVPVSRAAIAQHLEGAAYRDLLLELWDRLLPVAPFAFRVLDEIRAYVAEAEQLAVPWQEALDEQLLHKILPKLKGADERTTEVLAWLAERLDGQFRLSHAKVSAMLDAARRYGFTSYFQS